MFSLRRGLLQLLRDRILGRRRREGWALSLPSLRSCFLEVVPPVV